MYSLLTHRPLAALCTWCPFWRRAVWECRCGRQGRCWRAPALPLPPHSRGEKGGSLWFNVSLHLGRWVACNPPHPTPVIPATPLPKTCSTQPDTGQRDSLNRQGAGEMRCLESLLSAKKSLREKQNKPTNIPHRLLSCHQ